MVHVVLVPTVHCCNKVVLNRPCCVFASWLFSAKLVYKILQTTFYVHKAQVLAFGNNNLK